MQTSGSGILIVGLTAAAEISYNISVKVKITAFLLLLLFLVGCATNKYANVKNLHTASGTALVCFGNSLTAGEGAPPGEDYPSLLAKELPLPVVNAGLSGDTAAAAISRIEKDVLSKNPKVVIVELGANDFLRAAGSAGARDEAFKSLEIIIDKIQEYGAVVVVAGISINYEIEKGYEKLARKEGAVLVPDIMGGIFNNPDLMADNLHPNAEGYKIMTGKFIEILGPLLEEMQ